jgi:hypothetical protein
MMDKIKSFIKEKMGDGGAADIAKQYQENASILQKFEALNASMRPTGSPEASLEVLEKKFLEYMRKEEGGF